MTAEQQLERSVLESKERDELHAIAQALSVKTTTRTKKADIIDRILKATGVGPADGAPTARRPRARARPGRQPGGPRRSQAAGAALTTAQRRRRAPDADGRRRRRPATTSPTADDVRGSRRPAVGGEAATGRRAVDHGQAPGPHDGPRAAAGRQPGGNREARAAAATRTASTPASATG